MDDKTPIYCPFCKIFVGYVENYMWMVIPINGIKCDKCGEIAIHSNNPLFHRRIKWKRKY